MSDRSDRILDLMAQQRRLQKADADYRAAIETMQRKMAVNFVRLRSVEAEIANLTAK